MLVVNNHRRRFLLACCAPLPKPTLWPWKGKVSGLAPSYGRPLSLECLPRATSFVRQLPGRLAGETVDTQGSRGFVADAGDARNNIFAGRRLRPISAPIKRSCAPSRDGATSPFWARKDCAKWRSKIFPKRNLLSTKLTKIPGVRRVFDGPFFKRAHAGVSTFR